MRKYVHILAPIDFSASAAPVLQRAVDETHRHGGRLTLLHVIEYYPEDVPEDLVPPETENPVAYYLDRARARVRDLAKANGAAEAKQLVLASTGAAYHEVVRHAQEESIDLIVMGYQGRWVTDALGSTAMAVTRHAVCDVLVVRNGAIRTSR